MKVYTEKTKASLDLWVNDTYICYFSLDSFYHSDLIFEVLLKRAGITENVGKIVEKIYQSFKDERNVICWEV